MLAWVQEASDKFHVTYVAFVGGNARSNARLENDGRLPRISPRELAQLIDNLPLIDSDGLWEENVEGMQQYAWIWIGCDECSSKMLFVQCEWALRRG
jgi:hypothetical protein